MHGIKPTSEQLICTDTWRDKYRYAGDEEEKVPGDSSYEDTCRRVIRALCVGEPSAFEEKALRAMLAREIVPAGRILAGAGTDKRVTLINCFVTPDIQDSMATDPDKPGAGIMDALSKAAYTLQMGGGVGMDFSTIRPRGAVVKRTSSVSSGVLPFMDMWHHMSNTIMSAGHRRGAMMGVLGIWHPDIEEFIEAKKEAGRLTNFNISVLVPDSFMQAMADDGYWDLLFPVPKAVATVSPTTQTKEPLASAPSGDLAYGYVYKQVRARELWDKIVGSTYIYAEPGVIFIDRVNNQNNLRYCEHIHATNPCGEQPLPANGDCNLGHTNLAVMVSKPFESDADFRWDKLEESARIMVRLLDNVLDVTQWPTEEQKQEARDKRRIGLGFTGLASALQQLGIEYGSSEAVEFTREVAKCQALAAYSESVGLAKERGPFPNFDNLYMSAPFIRKLPQDLMLAIEEHGIRNGVLLSIAPTGTTSLVVGNVSSGVEPVFGHKYRRKVRAGSGELTNEYFVYDYGFLEFCRLKGVDPETLHESNLPAGFITAAQLTVEQHLQMAAAAQEWTDAAISKTINCPTSMTFGEFKAVYTRAYELGMKGCTTYRPDPRSGRGAVLEVPDAKSLETSQEVRDDQLAPALVTPLNTEALLEDGAPASIDKIPMQDVVDGRRYRIKWPTEDCTYYLTITDYVDGRGQRRPFELFINTKSERHSEWVKVFSLLVTAIFRRGGDPTFIVDELRSVFSAAGGTWVRVPWSSKPKLAPSLVAAIGLKIEEHMRWLGMVGAEEDLGVKVSATSDPLDLMPAQELLDVCDHCGARAVVYQEGCATCHACGKSDCG